jgi:pyruvate/2-oxoacid:ferredoxin oxidoreductase alpha subunit
MTPDKLRTERELIKGNEAAVKAAVLAGCRSFFGYPITPASEIAHAAADYLPLVGGTFLQAESEIGAINMCYGAAASGVRCMTASSSPGISLKQEGISYAAGAELPIVIVDIMRGGPGLGNIAPEQSDYNQMVKGGGHGNYHLIVLAPNSAQEMCDLTFQAFDIADRYRCPVCILADGFIGQMMEPVAFPAPAFPKSEKDWAVRGDAETTKNFVTSIDLEPEALEKHILHLESKYAEAARNELRWEEYRLDDAEYVLIGYGIVSRILRTVVEKARAEGQRVGMLRPISLWPFPSAVIEGLTRRVKGFLVVELSNGQMVDDVRLAVGRQVPVHLYTRCGGMVMTTKEVFDKVQEWVAEAQNEGAREAAQLLPKI